MADEPFASAIITVMLASRQLLEARAAARARRELSLLVQRAPRTARRRVGAAAVEVPVDDVVVGDLSGAAHIGVVIKGGGALEALAGGRILLFDKTGNLTQGHPVLADVVTAAAFHADDVLRLTVSLDQVSPYALAGAIVAVGTRRALALRLPKYVQEVHGYGLAGTDGGRRVRLGKASWVVGDTSPPWVRQVRRRADLHGSLTVFIAVDDEPAGAFLLQDAIRPKAPRMVRALRKSGIARVVLVTGDRAEIAQMIGRIVGVDSGLADAMRGQTGSHRTGVRPRRDDHGR